MTASCAEGSMLLAIYYLEWVMLLNQAVTIRSEYIDALRNLNTTTIQLNNFSNK